MVLDALLNCDLDPLRVNTTEMLKKTFFSMTVLAASLLSANAQAGTLVKMNTSAGEIIIELEDEKAPVSAANFANYVKAGFYDQTIFHRVIPGFVIQGGGFTADDISRKTTEAPIENEADNGLKNSHYSLSMARTSDPSSATSQFFINLQDNASLDHTAKDSRGWGYAVFGRVIEGQEVVDQIATVKTGSVAGMRDVPLKPVRIESATLLEK